MFKTYRAYRRHDDFRDANSSSMDIVRLSSVVIGLIMSIVLMDGFSSFPTETKPYSRDIRIDRKIDVKLGIYHDTKTQNSDGR